jgi:hypothetical protein
MVAEVVWSVMGNRSDRRFPNLSCAWALEAVQLTRRKRADFHQGPEAQSQAPHRGRIYGCNRLHSYPGKHPFARGWVHIRHRGQQSFIIL